MPFLGETSSKSSVQIITLLFSFTVQKYIDPPVSKVHPGSFPVSVIHQTLTWTTGSLTCIRSYACVYTRGWGTQTSQHNMLTRKNSHKFFFSSGWDSNLWSWNSLDLEADACALTDRQGTLPKHSPRTVGLLWKGLWRTLVMESEPVAELVTQTEKDARQPGR